jgi:hypothetical protein
MASGGFSPYKGGWQAKVDTNIAGTQFAANSLRPKLAGASACTEKGEIP